MTTKINSYILPKETKNEMVDAISRSIRSKLEHGFNLCLDKDKNIRPGKLCKGKKCSMETAEFECKDDEKTIGTFHTHTRTLNPSVSDLHIGYLSRMSCIGSFEGVRCFKRKKEDFDALEHSDIRFAENKERFIKMQYDKLERKEITNKEFKKDYDYYMNEINRLVNSYFNVINVKMK